MPRNEANNRSGLRYHVDYRIEKCMKKATIVALLFPLVVMAQGTGLYFLSDAPLAKFTDEDRQIFRDAAIGALNNAADGEKVPWSNPDTDARGVITPLETVDDDVYGLCRSVRVSNERAGARRSGVYRAC